MFLPKLYKPPRGLSTMRASRASVSATSLAVRLRSASRLMTRDISFSRVTAPVLSSGSAPRARRYSPRAFFTVPTGSVSRASPGPGGGFTVAALRMGQSGPWKPGRRWHSGHASGGYSGAPRFHSSSETTRGVTASGGLRSSRRAPHLYGHHRERSFVPDQSYRRGSS